MAATSRDEYLMQQFRQLAARHEISDYFAGKLRQLEGFEIVLILDDSGSMSTPLAGSQQGPFSAGRTRWQEMKETVSVIVDIAAVMDKDGLDIFFLNRATLSGVTSSAQLEPVFAAPPAGLTPITPVLQHVLKAKAAVSVEKKVLVIVLTDGQPTNASGQVDIESLRRVMQHERNAERVFVSFVACTDDLDAVAYLNKWDKEMRHVDVVDDYVSERAEIRKKKGANFAYSHGDHVVKLMLGAIDPEFDKLDESSGACCAVQ